MTNDRTPQDPTPAALARANGSRRQLLKTAGLVALVGAGGSTLAACSTGTAATPAAGSAAPSSTNPSAGAGSKAAKPSVATAEVPVGGGFIMPDADYVVTQPSKGTYKAFSKICTHAGCPVTQIADKEIICRCHGSHFSIADGSVISGPAQSPLPEATAKVAGNTVVVSS